MTAAVLATIALSAASVASAAPGIDNGFKFPAMGWSALYGAPFQRVNETIVTTAAEGLNSSGLIEFGYNRVNLDDWYAIRDGTSGKIKGSPHNFPSGMAACSAKVHAAGCLFGVYSSASMRTCGNWTASLFNEVNDANTFANDWKIDMLKYDACRYNYGVTSRPRYEAMGMALNKTGRPILYSVEGWAPGDDAGWGPQVADSWRTGSDIWPNWDNKPNCILNNLYQTNAAAPYHIVGKGFNDPDMLQPPNTLITVLKPGLTPEESYSQYKLWVVMKSPLVLGVNWAQIADLKTLEPTYYALLTNREILGINQDMSPQGTLVRQFPSMAQQAAAAPSLHVTYQPCDDQRASQRWVAGAAAGTVQLKGTTLCLHQNGTTPGVELDACSASSLKLGMVPDDTSVHVGTVGATGNCMVSGASARVPAPTLAKCIYSGPIPPVSVLGVNFASQAYVWGPTTGQIVGAGSGTCLTAGLSNYDKMGNNGKGWVTNNGTLEHEVWMGDLTPHCVGAYCAPRRVVALFNKGKTAEPLSAPASLFTRDLVPAAASVKVRDVVSRKDVAVAPGASIIADVPSHGVALFVVTF